MSSIDPSRPPARPHRRRHARGARRRAAADVDPALHRSQHADYQADLALALARKLKKNPREVATAIAAQLPPDDVIAGVEVSGPGFLNLTLRADDLAARVERMRADARLGVAARRAARDGGRRLLGARTSPRRCTSATCAARSSATRSRACSRGRATASSGATTSATGARRSACSSSTCSTSARRGADAGVRELGAFYRAARAKFDGDPGLRRSRAPARRAAAVGRRRDARALAAPHRRLRRALLAALRRARRDAAARATSSARAPTTPLLPGVVDELAAKGLAVESEGAICVFPPGFTGREGEPVPLIIRKQEGGYGYATTDLAALRQRVARARRDAPHLRRGRAADRSTWRWCSPSRASRAGPTTACASSTSPSARSWARQEDAQDARRRLGSLAALVEEAVARAAKVVAEKSPDLPAAEQARIAARRRRGRHQVRRPRERSHQGLRLRLEPHAVLRGQHGALPDVRARAHPFDPAQGGARRGGRARAPSRSRRRRSARSRSRSCSSPGTLERAGGDAATPHRICTFLYDVASAFTSFYEGCPVLKAEGATRASRLALCDVTARTLALGLDLLGISAPDQM